MQQKSIIYQGHFLDSPDFVMWKQIEAQQNSRMMCKSLATSQYDNKISRIKDLPVCLFRVKLFPVTFGNERKYFQQVSKTALRLQ